MCHSFLLYTVSLLSGDSDSHLCRNTVHEMLPSSFDHLSYPPCYSSNGVHTLFISLLLSPLHSPTLCSSPSRSTPYCPSSHPLRQVHTPQDHDRRTTTPYRSCTPPRTSPNQQIYPALYRRPRPLHDTSGLLPRTLAGFNQGRRKKISREIRYFWVSLCSLYSVFLFFST